MEKKVKQSVFTYPNEFHVSVCFLEKHLHLGNEILSAICTFFQACQHCRLLDYVLHFKAMCFVLN